MVSWLRKIFGPWTMCLGLQTTHSLYNGHNTLFAYRNRQRSSGLVGRLALCSAKCTLPVILYALSNTIELNTVTVKRKAEGEALIAWTKHIWREIRFLVEVKVSLNRPSEGSKSLRLPVLSDNWHMKVARLSGLRIGRLYALG